MQKYFYCPDKVAVCLRAGASAVLNSEEEEEQERKTKVNMDFA